MRLLAIDAGNTRIKWGLHDGREWLQRGVTAADGIGLLPSALQLEPDCLIISNVSGPAAEAAFHALFPGLPRYTVRSANAQCGVTNGYADAAQLGSDRWAALIAVHRLNASDKSGWAPIPVGHNAGMPALVVTAGTALTADVLHQGRFLGGIIMPGYRLMHHALSAGTAQLSDMPGKFDVFPKNTLDAISSGCLLAMTGCVEQMRTLLLQQTGLPAAIWLNGGDAALLAPHFPDARVMEENLVLTGLYFIALEVFA